VKKYWPVVNHIMAKDIIRFHCIVWPAIVLALGLEPPRRVFSHGWWTVEGEKMSKSKGNVVDPFEMADIYGTDAFRYFLLREIPFGADGDFSESGLVQRINSDLANDLGNLLNRTLQMINKFSEGKVPEPGELHGYDRDLKDLAEKTMAEYREAMDVYAFDEALKATWKLVRRGNKYIDETMPWKLGREKDTERLGTVLYTLEEVLRLSALLVAPVIPETAARIWAQLGIEQEPAMSLLDDYRWGDRAPGSDVGRKEVLFPRIDMKQWEEEKAGRDAKKGLQPDPGEHEEEISIDDFRKVELRVAKVISVDVVPKADKLYKIHLDLGYERRTIVSGIREEYAPEELEGMKIIVICNLKPATIRGVESKGMLLAAETPGEDGLALLTVDRDIPLGARVR